MATLVLSLSPRFLHTRLAFTRSSLLGKTAVAEARPKISVPAWIMPLVTATTHVTMVVGVMVAAALFVPNLYYAFAPADVVPVQALEEGSALGGKYEQGRTQTAYQPPKNENLPTGSWISIPSIGVRSELRDTEDPEEALRQGIWWSPTNGKPGETGDPMIVAGHRYGYKVWWQDDYWKYNTFYRLPELKPGDVIEVIHDQRKWVYEIYAGEEGKEITDYEADLILYTCKFLNSPVRHFRYARLIDPTKNSQTQLVVNAK